MSLQLAAQHLASQGRGKDTELVHMDRGELQSLQKIAQQHGGNLSINPHTGLPEAGFLSSILPMVAGVALGPAGLGLTAMEAGLAGGALGMITNPKGGLMGGLMAGMGAYGGAGLGEALASQGVQEATQQKLAQDAAYQAQQTAAQTQAAALGQNAANLAPEEFAKQAQSITNPLNTARAEALANEQNLFKNASFSDKLSTLGQGVKTLGTGEGWSQLASNAGGGTKLAQYGLMAASPVVRDYQTKMNEIPTSTPDRDLGRRYTYNPGQVQPTPTADPYGREQRYFTPSYSTVSSDQARNIFGFADGGVTPAPGEPTQYSYDPLGQKYNKIEPPSSAEAKKGSSLTQQGGGHTTPMTDAQFAAQQAQGEKNAESLGLSSLGDAIGNGIHALLSSPPMAVQIAQSLMSSLGINTGNSTSASNSPNAKNFNPAADSQAANEGLGNAVANGGTGPGFGAPGPSTGNAGALGTGPNGMAAGAAPGGGDARGGYIAHHKFDQRMADGGPIQSLGDLEYQNTGVARMAMGGIPDQYNLGGYSDGGRLLRGPGDGVSDSIPATIGQRQPARLADGEFVVPARIVSELGNGSTEAGARKLYAMMDRVQKARSKTVGKGNVAKNSRAEQYLPA